MRNFLTGQIPFFHFFHASKFISAKKEAKSGSSKLTGRNKKKRISPPQRFSFSDPFWEANFYVISEKGQQRTEKKFFSLSESKSDLEQLLGVAKRSKNNGDFPDFVTLWALPSWRHWSSNLSDWPDKSFDLAFMTGPHITLTKKASHWHGKLRHFQRRTKQKKTFLPLFSCPEMLH